MDIFIFMHIFAILYGSDILNYKLQFTTGFHVWGLLEKIKVEFILNISPGVWLHIL